MPITGPTRSRNLLVTRSDVISFGRSSPGNKFIVNDAVEDPGPMLFIIFSTKCFSLSVPKYSSLISLVTSIALLSINEIILSVTF